MNLQEALAQFAEHRPMLARAGIVTPGVRGYIPDGWKEDFDLAMDQGGLRIAMDAQPALTTEANSSVPAFLTTYIDPSVFKILFAPNRAATIFGEVRKGNWLDETAMFPTVEHDGEVSSYGDFSENGHAGANTNWPQLQSYLFQVIEEYGEREMERAGLAKINWVTELDQAAATILSKFLNLSYFYGVQGLQQFGLLNDPNLSAALTPATKANGGTKWINGTVMNATANEVYADIQSMYLQLVNQTAGIVQMDTPMVLALSPASEVALSITNTFNVNVEDLLKKNFKNLRVESAMQYQQLSSSNPQGQAAGNLVQLIAESLEGQDAGYCAFNEKMRSHPIIRGLSSFKRKLTSGTFGAVIRQPMAIASMLGV